MRGVKQVQEHHQLVGQCISLWAMLDEQLFNTCRLVLGTSAEIAAVVYFEFQTFNQRLTLTDKLVRHTFEGEPVQLAAWKSLHSRLASGARVRNRLAHSVLRGSESVTIYPEGSGQAPEYVSDWWIDGNPASPKAKGRPLRRQDIERNVKDAGDLHRRLGALVQSLTA